MRVRRWGMLAIVAAVAGGAVAARPRVDAVRDAQRGEAAEVSRIQSHFDSVRSELASVGVSGLTAWQVGRRRAVIAALGAYRDRGVFPHNYDFPGQAIPYFVDRKTGTLCAVANLLAVNGRRDIVDRVARSNNNVWVAQLAGDAAFVAWLDSTGITLAEAARIQVPYVAPRSTAEVARNTAFLIAAPFVVSGVAVSSIWNATGNADGHRPGVTRLGVWSGIASSVMGAAMMTKRDIPPMVGSTALAMGVASIAFSARASMRQSVVARERVDADRRVVADAQIAPTVDARGAYGARVGVSVGF